ncbi:phenylalanine--tRNA ligase subunit alpha [Patescibacteria group bacterium]
MPVNKIKTTFKKELKTTKDLDKLYLKYLGRQGIVTGELKNLKNKSLAQRKKLGPELNKLKAELTQQIEKTKKSQTKKSDKDLTIPVKPQNIGYLHPTTQIIREMNKFFRYHGFSIMEGPEIETEEYNFRRLNLPKGHPATDLQDTLYVKGDILLRTHTSSVEARVLSDYKPPIRAVVAGKVYRNETPNATNVPFFHHYQGFVVDKGITLQHLKGTLDQFHRFLFGDDVKLRFRYKYYPEVSPGMGVDMQCEFCKGRGCIVCKHRGWVEVLGSGMIHYNTMKMCGIDPEEYTGYAFGIGLDRLVLQRFGIDDIRKLYDGGMVYK